MVVDVIDTGVGIKEEDLDKLFKFFGCLTRTKDSTEEGWVSASPPSPR